MASSSKFANTRVGRTPAALVGAVLWLLCFQFFVVEQVARLSFRGAYSMRVNMISDLGALKLLKGGTSFSPLHSLMNASFMLQGVLIAGGALLVGRILPARLLTTAASACFVVSGTGVLLVGIVPEDAGGSLHVLGALLHFLSGGFGMLFLGLTLRRPASVLAGLPSTLSLAAGALALGGTLLLGLCSQSAAWRSLGLPLGAVERIAAYPLPLWLTASGYLLLTGKIRTCSSSNDPPAAALSAEA